MFAILRHAHTSNEMNHDMLAIAGVICISFFFLCWLGKNSLCTNSTPFCLQDGTPHRGVDMLAYETTGAVKLDDATSVALTFTTQKNDMKGEVTHNGMTGDPHTCPV